MGIDSCISRLQKVSYIFRARFRIQMLGYLTYILLYS